MLAVLTIGNAAAQEEPPYQHRITFPGDPILLSATIILDEYVENPPTIIRSDRPPFDISVPSLPVLTYLIIEGDNLVNRVELRFAVPRIWFEQNATMENRVVILGYENGWTEHAATLTNADNEFYYYFAKLPYGAVFAIGAHRKQVDSREAVIIGLMLAVAVISFAYWLTTRPEKPFASLKKIRAKISVPVAVEEIDKEKKMAETLKQLKKKTIHGTKDGSENAGG